VAKSLSSILSQIERLQKEANAIQLDVVARIRKDIAKFGLTAEQLFGTAAAAKSSGVKPARAAKATRAAKPPKAPKFADGLGNTWGGMGKRPDWLRQALAAGKALEDFLIGQVSAAAPAEAKPAKAPTKAPAKAKAVRKAKPAAQAKAAPEHKSAAKKRAPAKNAASRKPRTKATTAPDAT